MKIGPILTTSIVIGLVLLPGRAALADEELISSTITVVESRSDARVRSYQSWSTITAVGNGAIALSGDYSLYGHRNAGFAVISADGHISWAKRLVGEVHDLYAVPDGGLLVATSSPTAEVIRFDATGRVLWARSFATEHPSSMLAIATAGSKGGVFAVGHVVRKKERYYENRRINHTFSPFVTKLDPDGNVIWTKAIGLEGSVPSGGAAPDTDGGLFVVIGEHLVHLDAAGNPVWARRLEFAGHGLAVWNPVPVDNGVVLAGTVGHLDRAGLDAFAVSVDSAGQIRWAASIDVGASDRMESVAATNDGGVVLAGGTRRMGPTLEDKVHRPDGWLVKLHSNGNISWSSAVGGVFDDFLNAVTVTKDVVFAVGHIKTAKPDSHPVLVKLPLSTVIATSCHLVTPIAAQVRPVRIDAIPVELKAEDHALASDSFERRLSPLHLSLQPICD